MGVKRLLRCEGVKVERVQVETARALLPADLEPTRIITIRSPWGSTRPHDSDRVVAEYEAEFGADAPFAVSIMRSSFIGGVWVTRWHIRYNLTKILRFEPGPLDWRAIRRHERAHCRGWGHGEGSAEENAAFKPTVVITGN